MSVLVTREVDGMPVTDAMLDQLIKHFVTNDLAARASQ